MKKRLNILWLPGWFPSKQDFLSGDFIERHAKAVSMYANVVVLFVTKDFTLPPNHQCVDIEENNGLIIYRGYYNCTDKLGLISKLWSGFLYYKLLFDLYRVIKKKYQFDLVHLYIVLKQSILALFIKWREGIQFVITEQNSWFVKIGNQFYTNQFLFKKLIQISYKNAANLQVVSKELGNSIQAKFPGIKNYVVIPNVVDTNSFFYKNTDNLQETNFFAITGNTFHKNTDGLIRGFSGVLKNGFVAKLHIAGENIVELKWLVAQLDIENEVIFHGAISNAAVAKLMQDADAFVFFTRYETFGCVMAEALCCGKPVIASKIPVLTENLTENENAIFAESENEADLTQKLIYFITNKDHFNAQKIAEDAIAKYNYETVGALFLNFYNASLELNPASVSKNK